MRVADWSWSRITEVGAMVTVGVASTVTSVFEAGVAVGVGVAPPVVPVSVTVMVSTQLFVVPVGVNVRVERPELLKAGQLPVAIDQRYVNVPVPPEGVAVIVTDWPWSMTTDVGAIDIVGVALTVTPAFVAGRAVGVGVAPPVGTRVRQGYRKDTIVRTFRSV